MSGIEHDLSCWHESAGLFDVVLRSLQVDETHEGVYSCTPYNALGTEGPSAGVRVRVQRPPAFAARPLPLYVARLGATLSLPCKVAVYQHNDPPLLRWTRVSRFIYTDVV